MTGYCCMVAYGVNGQCSLVLCAVTGDSARKDLSSLGHVSLQFVGVLVIDYVIFTTEYAYFLSSANSAFSSHWRIGFVCLIKSHVSASCSQNHYT